MIGPAISASGITQILVATKPERRAPGVQHGGDADPRTEAPGVGGDGKRRLGCRLHQQVVDHALVLVGNVTQLARQRVHDVEVRYRQQLRLAIGQPSA
jgi:hypothetical protein